MNAALLRFIEQLGDEPSSSGPLDPRVDRGIPLAVSVLKGERHYDPAAERLCGLIEVLLDGDRLDRIVAYDVPAGTIVRQRRDWRGRVLIERGAPVLETLAGSIEVRWLPLGEALRGRGSAGL